mgnify:CR=1 FL=1
MGLVGKKKHQTEEHCHADGRIHSKKWCRGQINDDDSADKGV